MSDAEEYEVEAVCDKRLRKGESTERFSMLDLLSSFLVLVNKAMFT